MTNTVNIVEVTLAEASDATNAVNLTPVPETMGHSEVIRITDHKDNDATEVGNDTDKMAIFTRKAHGHPWKRTGNRLGGINFMQESTPVAVPTNVEVLFPNFPYTTDFN